MFGPPTLFDIRSFFFDKPTYRYISREISIEHPVLGSLRLPNYTHIYPDFIVSSLYSVLTLLAQQMEEVQLKVTISQDFHTCTLKSLWIINLPQSLSAQT